MDNGSLFFSTLFLFLTNNPFLKMALLASLSASIASGIVGSYVVVKRIVFISGSIAHSVLGGMGLILYLKRTYQITWLNPIYGAFVSAILAAFLIGWIHLYYKQREDTVIAALWAFGMSLGVILISLTPGYNVELTNFLFGSLLFASHTDIYILFALDILILGIVAIFHHRFLAICFDEQQAILQKQKVKTLYFLLLCLTALTVVILIQIMGAILVIALLSLPAAIANTFTHRLSKMMGIATLFSVIICILGITSSYFLNWPPGATIAMTATIFYLFNLIRHTKKNL